MDKQNSSKSDVKTKTSKNSSAKKKNFLVVGLGASAGGVKALQEFFGKMPPNSGMAFVVILHLSPEHESNLPEIIQAQTAMPVRPVSETLKVEPNHVYVIQPNRQLEMSDGVIRSIAPDAEAHARGARVAIDVFFRTLAEAYKKNAVCVVLSGSGTDGTLGLKAVKEANGFAIVQDPLDAEYDSMPRSAIMTHLVDWVLPVGEMPEKLIRFRSSSERLHLTTDDGDQQVARQIQADDSLREILTILRIRTGHDFSNYKTPTLVRRIARHLQIHDLVDIPSYLEFLRTNPDEIHSLMKNLLINVTNFFRDKEAWEALEKEVIPGLFAGKKSGDTLRVWSCACASGEEAYSLAMILSEYAYNLQDPPKIQVFATDVDEDAIAEAREHLYPQSIEADVSLERLKRFFVKEGKYYRIKKELREMVLFAPHNVLRDPPFSKLNLVACRNLLIYLNRETQDRVMEIFHFALAPGGYLFLGSSESAESVTPLFAQVNKKYRIFARRSAHLATPGLPRLPIVGRWEARMPEFKSKKRDIATYLGEIHHRLLEKFATPSALVNQDFNIQYLSESAGRYLSFKGGEPSSNLLKLVHSDLLPDLRSALFTALREQKTVEFKEVRALIEEKEVSVDIIVHNVEIDNETSDYLLVIFEENKKFETPKNNQNTPEARLLQKDEAVESLLLRLENDLARTREHLRTTIEQYEISTEELKASNEELQAINEELRSTTEELETSKEELQSVNEELTTVNQEHREKIEETMHAYSDLQNLLASTNIATIFLDRRFRIKRLTPPVEQLFNISVLDIGRPLEHFTHKLNYTDLTKDAAEVLRSLSPVEREIRDHANRTYLTRLLPYRTMDDRIEGVVLNFVDITERKQSEKARSLLASIVESSEDSILTTGFDGKITSWNKAAERLYGYSAKEAVGKPLTMLSLPEDLQKVLDNTDKIKQNQRVETFDSVTIKKDGHEMNLEVALSPVRDENGAVVGVSTIARDVTERRRAEEALRKSEERMQKAMFIETVGIIFFDLEGRIHDSNEAFQRMSGYAREDLRAGNVRWDETTPPEFMDITQKSRNELLSKGKNSPYEKQSVRPDGSRWWGLFAGKRLSENECVEFVIDITERKRAELTARESDERMRIAIEAAALATWEWDLTTDQVFWNDQHFFLFGLRPRKTSVTPEEFFKYVHPDDRPRVREELQTAIREKSDFDTEFCIVRKDGTTRWMSGYGRVTDEAADGTALKVSGVMFDINARKQAEESLHKSEEQLKLILESTKDYAIITFDLEGRITRWNAGAEKIFGYTEKEAVGKTTHLIFTPEDIAAGMPEKELKSTLDSGRAEDERWHIRKNGSRFYASGVMQLLRDGALEGFVKICRDQTAKLEAEQSLVEKEMLRRLVSAQEDERRRIARDIHDHFGQQITALRLKLDAIKNAADGNTGLIEQTEEAQKTAAALDADVDFIAWELRPASLDDLGLRVALAQFVAEWSNHTGVPAEFHTSGLGKSRLEYEIETNLYRIAQEALNNIHKHARAENVSVLLEKNRNKVSLIIEDNGVGFNPKDKANRRKGLGLVGMNERAKISGGTLEIESGKGKGTTLFVRVPVKK
jgi:two-component system, chemotaxis family, CheB/CheR fusion protein